MLRDLRDLLRAPPTATASDMAAFETYTAELFAQLGTGGVIALAACTVLWWPLDGIVFEDPSLRAAFAGLRSRGLLVELAVLLAFWRLPRGSRHAIRVGQLGYACFVANLGYSLGSAARPDIALLADAMMGIVPVVLMPLSFAPRARTIALVGGALLGGFFLPFPANIHLSDAPAQLSFGIFAMLFTLALGELSFRVVRGSFLQHRALDRANAALHDLSATLSQRVDERTAELRALATHLAQVQEAERRRIARDLHDDLGQSLTAMRYTIARLEDRVARASLGTDDHIADLNALLDGTTATVRSVLSTLRPRILDDLGVVAAAEWLCERLRETSGVECVLEIDEASRARAPELSADVALAAFRMLQESTTNALRHGAPSRIDVRFRCVSDVLELEVRDDGEGFDTSAAASGLGLLGLRERVRAVDGELRITSAVGAGTTLEGRFPLAARRLSRNDLSS